MPGTACLAIAILVSSAVHTAEAQIIKVPSDFQTIALAAANAKSGDTIILSPGTYYEKNIVIDRALTISSQWILTGDTAVIESTVIDAQNAILFTVTSNNVEISGLKIINGDHTLDINARVSIKYNILVNNVDGISMESNAGGYIGYNLIENNGSGDDCIDLDIGKNGSDIVIEHNKLFDANDDGIEIRLFSTLNQNIHYEIRYNTITGSKKAGIQLISYDVYTGKVFNIHHNIFQNCMTGLGCMEGSHSSEDLSGASKMDEKVYFYNNTMLDNKMGATGGNHVFAINNLVSGKTIGGFKMFGGNSVVANNLLYNNLDQDFIGFRDSVEIYDNITTQDPLLDEITLRPGQNSPCIDAGLAKLILDGETVIEIPAEEYSGSAPDIGALESNYPVSVGGSPASVSDNHYIRSYPNPFTLSTKISFYLPQSGHVKVDIYDMCGRSINTLGGGLMEKGIHTIKWFAKDRNGNTLPGGIYIARMHTGDIIRNTRMLLLQ